MAYNDLPLPVLVAEDDSVASHLLVKTLQRWGHSVTSVNNGDTAWEILQKDTTPRIAILDWLMPGMDGIEIIRHLRAQPSECYVYTILLTCRDTQDDLVYGMQAGADDYIVKPFDPQELHVRIRAATRIVRQQIELAEARQQEIRIAGRIQKTLLFGKVVHDLSWCDNAVLAQPALQVGGDFYDFFRHSDTCYDVVIGDVMGKGVPAALLGAGVKSRLLHTINTLLTDHAGNDLPTPAEIISHVHAEITPELIDLESFITACYARFDKKTHSLTIVDCGHVPTLHCQSKTGVVTEIKPGNVPLGFLEKEKYDEMRIPLAHGDTFLFFTDGITEAQKDCTTLFGKQRLKECLHSNAQKSPRRILGAIVEELVEFTGGEVCEDDVTCISIKIK